MTGLSQAELFGQPLRSIMREEDAAAAEPTLRRALNGDCLLTSQPLPLTYNIAFVAHCFLAMIVSLFLRRADSVAGAASDDGGVPAVALAR